MSCQIILTKQNFIKDEASSPKLIGYGWRFPRSFMLRLFNSQQLIQVGNGLLDYATDFNSPDEYYWSHGLISDALYQLLTKVCNRSEIMRSMLNGYEVSLACLHVYEKLINESIVSFASIDTYNVIGDVCRSSLKSQADMLYEPLTSRFQTLSSLHSKPDALLSQKVKFTHAPLSKFILWCIFISYLYLKTTFSLCFYSKLKRRNLSVEKVSQKGI